MHREYIAQMETAGFKFKGTVHFQLSHQTLALQQWAILVQKGKLGHREEDMPVSQQLAKAGWCSPNFPMAALLGNGDLQVTTPRATWNG